ncbi:unnamed protein product [Peniophora sp. CBMAI 1063]|nr:unnamed protein product [Peniophora sp. CBMAI 1063]
MRQARVQARTAWHAFLNAFVTTALFRCWHILLFFGAWSTAISLISNYLVDLGIQNTLLTVLGTVLGFVISYRTTSSFERYNEGRRYWSQIVLGARTLARLIWFHVPSTMPMPGAKTEEVEARILIEKKTAINLTEAFAVAVKHYLRGEEGYDYADLFHLVKYLPSYPLPTGIPSQADLHAPPGSPTSNRNALHKRKGQHMDSGSSANDDGHQHVATARRGSILDETLPVDEPVRDALHPSLPATLPGVGKSSESIEKTSPRTHGSDTAAIEKTSSHLGPPPSPVGARLRKSIEDFKSLKPARLSPGIGWSDFFPSFFTRRYDVRVGGAHGRKSAKRHARMFLTHNLPLEITLYLSSYVAELQKRPGAVDGPTISALMASIQLLTDALTGLERIQTTPIPFSYSFHIWIVTLVYCFFLPFQLWTTLRWVAIPGTTIAAFVYFGFLVAGEEIENPFGYDKNDLDMDDFTHNIIRTELHAITSAPAPDPHNWVFSDLNDACFVPSIGFQDGHEDAPHHMPDRDTPEQWVTRGRGEMLLALKRGAM